MTCLGTDNAGDWRHAIAGLKLPDSFMRKSSEVIRYDGIFVTPLKRKEFLQVAHHVALVTLSQIAPQKSYIPRSALNHPSDRYRIEHRAGGGIRYARLRQVVLCLELL